MAEKSSIGGDGAVNAIKVRPEIALVIGSVGCRLLLLLLLLLLPTARRPDGRIDRD